MIRFWWSKVTVTSWHPIHRNAISDCGNFFILDTNVNFVERSD